MKDWINSIQLAPKLKTQPLNEWPALLVALDESFSLPVSVASGLIFLNWAGSKTLEMSFNILSAARLYFLTLSTDLWPVRFMISCSGTPAWYNDVAHVRFPEWFVKYPSIPASEHIVFIIVDNLFTPIGCSPNFTPFLESNGLL